VGGRWSGETGIAAARSGGLGHRGEGSKALAPREAPAPASKEPPDRASRRARAPPHPEPALSLPRAAARDTYRRASGSLPLRSLSSKQARKDFVSGRERRRTQPGPAQAGPAAAGGAPPTVRRCEREVSYARAVTEKVGTEPFVDARAGANASKRNYDDD
jgi:hypothetical protein